MSDNNEQRRKISRYIRHAHVGTGKHEFSENQMRGKRGKSALERIAEKGNHADLPAEFAAHIHRTRISAADFRDVFMLLFGDKPCEIETADKIAYRRQY